MTTTDTQFQEFHREYREDCQRHEEFRVDVLTRLAIIEDAKTRWQMLWGTIGGVIAGVVTTAIYEATKYAVLPHHKGP